MYAKEFNFNGDQPQPATSAIEKNVLKILNFITKLLTKSKHRNYFFFHIIWACEFN